MYAGLKRFLKRFELVVATVRTLRSLILECRKARWRIVRRGLIKSYIKSHQIRKLQIGAGTNYLRGWLNTDLLPRAPHIIYLDATRPFPFEKSTFHFIFCEHLIEHLGYDDALTMLRECYRVCKPGGRLRVATPDLEKLTGLYTEDNKEIKQRFIKWIIDTYLPERSTYRNSFVINNAFCGWGHQFLFDHETLQAALEQTGFIDVADYQPGESAQDTLKGIELHGKWIGDEDINRFETMVMEAKRPE